MAESDKAVAAPTRRRLIISAIIVLLIVIVVWKVIDYRQQPPLPQNKVGERVR